MTAWPGRACLPGGIIVTSAPTEMRTVPVTEVKPDRLDIPVAGGHLRALRWGTGDHVILAAHGITASAMSWQAVGRSLPAGWSLVAPDLRGRGASNGLPGPYGLDRHVEDLLAASAYLGGHPVLAGHSLGAYVALLAHDTEPGLAARLVLVDGGLPLPVPADADLDALLDASLGPALARLSQTYPSPQAYIDFWRAHPAFTGAWSADVEDYVRYDLAGPGGALRSRAMEAPVRADGRELLASGQRFAGALERLARPTTLLTAPSGMFGKPPGMQPDWLVATWRERAPQLRPELVPAVNHYTILFASRAAATVAGALTQAARFSAS
jgi:pimeloyl-ACP methyl ester carboxylesterase